MTRPQSRSIMRNSREGILILSCLALWVSAQARFTRMFGPIVKKDNLSDCRPAVREDIIRLDKEKWGEFHFECRSGFVRSVLLRPDSQAEKSFGKFIAENWKLFDVGPVSVDDAGALWPSLLYKRQGVTVISETNSGSRPFSAGGKVTFHDFLIQDIPSGVSSAPAVEKKMAVAKAVKLLASRKDGPHRVRNVELAFITGQCHYSQGSSKAGVLKPTLVWWIRADKHGAAPVSCFIDAKSGQPCEVGGACQAKSDPREL